MIGYRFISSVRIFILFLISAWACEVQAQSRRLIKAPKPQPASIAGYEKGHCVVLPKQVRICKALSESEEALLQDISGQKLKIVFRRDNNETTEFVYPNDNESEGGNELRQIGDGASGRLYPLRYLPSHPEAWLNGKRATLRTYSNDPRFHILWIEK